MNRFRHKDEKGELYTIIAFVPEAVESFGKIEYVTFIYCKDLKTGQPFKIPYGELFRYE